MLGLPGVRAQRARLGSGESGPGKTVTPFLEAGGVELEAGPKELQDSDTEKKTVNPTILGGKRAAAGAKRGAELRSAALEEPPLQQGHAERWPPR